MTCRDAPIAPIAHLPVFAAVLFALAAMLPASRSRANGLDAPWYAGADDCAASTAPPIEAHRIDARTFVLRESLCATPEAPFVYLLIGSRRALLIDTGDVADAAAMPLAARVLALLTQTNGAKPSLLVVHTHGHLDHRSGDAQLAALTDVDVDIVPTDLASVRSRLGFPDWPNGVATIDLGDRTVDVLPTPGHHVAHVSFYDRETALFFSGDFLLPGRLLIEDAAADRASAQRAADFVRDRPVRAVLGAHVERDRDGETFPLGAQRHANEAPLALAKDDVLALPAAVAAFNGFYTRAGGFVMANQNRILAALAAAALAPIGAFAFVFVRLVRRRRRATAKA